MAKLNLKNPLGYTGEPATQYKQGVVRLATDDEVENGLDVAAAVTPPQLQFATFLEFANPPVDGFGSSTPRPVNATTLDSTAGASIAKNAGAATFIGNTTGTLSFFGKAPGAVVSSQAAITNNVTATGTTGVIADFVGTTYATDSPAIKGDIYQLALALSNVITALRSYGLLS